MVKVSIHLLPVPKTSRMVVLKQNHRFFILTFDFEYHKNCEQNCSFQKHFAEKQNSEILQNNYNDFLYW